MAVLSDPHLNSASASGTGSGGTGEASLSEEYAAVARSVRLARDSVTAFAARHGAAPDSLEDIRLAVSEAATNCVMHAYGAARPGRFRVLAIVGRGQLIVVVDDDGCGLDAVGHTGGLGIGLMMMREVADEALFLNREVGGSTVQLRFSLTE